MKNNKRVVITGIGMISPVGIGVEENWSNLLAGRSGIDLITQFDASLSPSKIAGEVKNFNPEEYMDKKEVRRMDRFAQFAVAASKLAIADGKLDLEHEDMDRIGVIVGCGIGGLATMEEQCGIMLDKGPNKVSPFTVPLMITNMASGQIAIHTGAKGPNLTVVSACASGTHAIGDAFKLLQRGDANIVLSGGTEAAITPLGFASFAAARTLSKNSEHPQQASRPFDKDRDGFVMGEGATILVLEELEHALDRGAAIYAEVVGYGHTCDAYHITAPAPDGMGGAKAMMLAMKDAGINPGQIDYINAHGTSTDMNDRLETVAIKKAFGEAAKTVSISSTKSMTGHLLGAAGALEGGVIALSIKNDFIPPTINLDNPAEDCDLDYVPNVKRQCDVHYAMSNSLGFGGHNASIIFAKYID